MSKYRSHLIKDIDDSFIGKDITVSGFIANIRDHGGILFLDLRDESDILQTVSNDDSLFRGLSKESVITMKGKIRKRSEDTYNDNIRTGHIELLVEELKILSSSLHELPFEIITSKKVKEDVRLKYRYLDLRNNDVKKNVLLRNELLHFVRNKMYDDKFIEVQTPILTASSPEGARDFVVPSRLYKGKFYALPQAPQIYKELLMVGGIGKYFQVAPCFRDEDSRSDRTLEFYQLDLEMSFTEEDELLTIGEDIFYSIFKKFSDKKISSKPFKRISFKDAMNMYGTDKPDLRNPLIIKDASEILKNTSFKPFNNSVIKVIVVDNIGENPNSWFNEIVDYANSIGMPGIGYITLEKDGSLKGPIDKFLTEEERRNLIKEFNMKENSVMFFIANRTLKVALKFAGLIRTYLGNKIGLIDKNSLEFCIINKFPMFEYDEKEKKWDFCHNPFSKPLDEYKDYANLDLSEIVANQFDFVCNGYELASGAIRNTDLDLLEKGFEIVGYPKGTLEKRFSSLYTAFKYGVPPHGGMAAGLDRILMLILDEDNLREVQTFPTGAAGVDQMMGSPSSIDKKQLEELGIVIKEE